jgi:hypothetical protein
MCACLVAGVIRMRPCGMLSSGLGRTGCQKKSLAAVGRARREGTRVTSFLSRIRGLVTDKWAQRAGALGLTYHPSSDPHDTRSELRMPLFRRGGGGRVNDAMEGSWRDADVRLLSLAWHTAKTNQDEHWWLGLTPIDARTSPLHIGKVPPDDRSIDELELERVTFELEDFNRQWLVYAADPRVATAIVDQQMMSWLMTSHPQWDYELADGWLMVMREDLRASPSPYELEPVLEALLAFRERIPRAADSLFGSQDTT